MNVTRDVIIDLWPRYVEGEASADTRALIESFLHQDPEFARVLEERDVEPLLKQDAALLPPDREAQALLRTKRSLRGWNWLFFLAMLFSCFAFGRIVSDTSWDVSPKNFVITAMIAATFWVAFFVRLVAAQRRVFRETVGDAGPR